LLCYKSKQSKRGSRKQPKTKIQVAHLASGAAKAGEAKSAMTIAAAIKRMIDLVTG
jgi:hypothetical protein